MDVTMQALIQVFGPSGVLLGLGIIALRTIVPWLKEYLQAQAAGMARIADAMETMEKWQHGVSLRLDRVERLTGNVSEDMAGLYEKISIPQPSERRRHSASHKPREDQP